MDGVLIIDKPAGWTSHDVVARVRRVLRTKKVGHTGTLDPFATGVLVILVGRATRLAQFLDKSEKEYLATIRFGFATTTGDLTGEARGEIADSEFRISDSEIETALTKFRGEIWQTPPMYSAKKQAGVKLYELARKGVEVERQPVKIKISKLELVEPDEQSRIDNPQSTIRTVVSAGTYIRVLAEDIGRELGVGAHLIELRRTRAGAFDLQSAVTLDELENLAAANRVESVLITPKQALAHLPLVTFSERDVKRTLNGLPTSVENQDFRASPFVGICDEIDNLIAVAAFDADERTLRPAVVIGTA